MSSRRLACRRAFHALEAAVFLSPGVRVAAGAQQSMRVVRGVVLDTAARPVSGVTIEYAGRARVVTNDSGHFQIRVNTGSVVLDIRRLGFLPSRFGLPTGRDTAIDVTLIPVARQIAAVEVNARQRDATGFLERTEASRRGGVHGIFITRDAIEKRNAGRVSDLFQDLPGVSVHAFGPNHYVLLGRHLVPVTAGRTNVLVPCAMALYIDGARVGRLDGATIFGPNAVPPESIEINALVQPSEIYGIEYYERASSAPAQFQALNGSCGVVVIWTERGTSQ